MNDALRSGTASHVLHRSLRQGYPTAVRGEGAYFIEEQHIDEIVDKLAAAIDAAVSAVARTSA